MYIVSRVTLFKFVSWIIYIYYFCIFFLVQWRRNIKFYKPYELSEVRKLNKEGLQEVEQNMTYASYGESQDL